MSTQSVTSRAARTKASDVTDRFIRTICSRLSGSKRVRRDLPIWGRVHIDRQLPFLCIYRRPRGGQRNDAGTQRLATSEASYLTCDSNRKLHEGLSRLVRAIASTQVDQFGSCLILEMWTGRFSPIDEADPAEKLRPRFRLVTLRDNTDGVFADKFEAALSRVKVAKRKVTVERKSSSKCCPKGMQPFLTPEEAREVGCQVFGLEIAPIFREAETGEVFPLVLRDLRRQLTLALRRAFFEFTRLRTTHQPKHYHTLGRRAMVKAVWRADGLLAACSESFDFLLQVTPVNAERAWNQFKRKRFEKPPTFHYRPLPVDPIELKRRLYETPVERVEDPALAQLLREKLDELDRQITMLVDINTPRFVQGSVQLFGGVEDSLLEVAQQVLADTPAHSRDDAAKRVLDAKAFAQLAEQEIDYYRQQLPELNATVTVRDDTTGLMVSHGSLLVSKATRIPASRAEALLQHEVGTHVLTYYNGRSQPFHQLYAGLAGYEALQEGLAVLSEYLVGGLSRPRLRLLAARVIAVRMLLDGSSFVETFRELHGTHHFALRVAFNVTMRTYRGGGFTKDAVYLRGLCRILEYLASGGDLEPLFVGKIASPHVSIVRELQWRKVLHDPPLTPRYMTRPDALARLEKLRQDTTVLDLLKKRQQRSVTS